MTRATRLSVVRWVLWVFSSVSIRVVVVVLLCGSCSSIVVVLVRVSRSRTVSRIYFGIGCAGFRFF